MSLSSSHGIKSFEDEDIEEDIDEDLLRSDTSGVSKRHQEISNIEEIFLPGFLIPKLQITHLVEMCPHY